MLNINNFKIYFKNNLFFIVSILFVVYYYYSTKSLPKSSTVFPKFIIIYMLIPVILWNLIRSIINIKEEKTKQIKKDGPITQKIFYNKDLKKKYFSVVLTLIYIFAIERLGFFVSNSLYLIIFSYVLGQNNIIKSTIFVIFINTIIYLLFVYWLKIDIIFGILF